MKKLIFLLFSCALTASFFGQIDFVQIDKLLWATTNLNQTTFRNGDPIRNAKTRAEWLYCLDNGIPAYCAYNNDTTLSKKYGLLYNWFAIADPRGLAPENTRVANNDDFSNLYIHTNIPIEGRARVANWSNMGIVGERLRSKTDWNSLLQGENLYNYNLLPGGYRNENGEFHGLASETALWVRDTMSYGLVTRGNALTSPFALVNGKDPEMYFLSDGKKTGCYVRLVVGEEEGLSSKNAENQDEFFLQHDYKEYTKGQKEDDPNSSGSPENKPKKRRKN